MDVVRSKTRQLGQILEKPCEKSRAYIFDPVLLKLCKNECHDKISGEFENGCGRVKSEVTRSNPRKTF